MFVCICKAVTERQIKSAILEGATCPLAIKQQLGAGSECGNCVECIQDILAEYVVPVANIHILHATTSQLVNSEASR